MKIKSYVVTAKASPESLFASISKRIAEPLVLYVDRDEKSKLYFVAFHSRVNQSDALSEAVKNLRGKEKSKIIALKEFKNSTSYFALALKDSCEFLELLISYNVKLVVPYTIHRGFRRFCVFGYAADIEKYLDNLRAYYGEKNVYVKNTDLQQCFEQALITASRNILLSELTPRELHVLYKGYATGYIVQPRKSGGLDAFSKAIGASKPAACITLKKAIGKVLRKIFEETV
ncbi:MAG: helix-turn-helix domain-containing protein [Desulfurococcaceae archaeon]